MIAHQSGREARESSATSMADPTRADQEVVMVQWDRRQALRVGAGAALAVTMGTGLPATAAAAAVAPTAVPARLRSRWNLDTRWYAKYVDGWGVPVLGSAQLSDAALMKARSRLGTMVKTSPTSPLAELTRRNVRVVVLARGERMSAIPEVSARYGTALDDRYWGGFGATDYLPISAGTEANLLDGEGGEDVFVHEFAHTVHQMALQYIDPAFSTELTGAWNAAQAAGRWRNTYAATNIAEYFAEGTQSYFDVNRVGPVGGDSIHNDVARRAALRTYDPPLFRLLNRVYRGARLA